MSQLLLGYLSLSSFSHFFHLLVKRKEVSMKTISFIRYKLQKLSRKYQLTTVEIEELYIRTLDDYTLLERACQHLAAGEDIEEVSLMIIAERK